MKVTYIILLCLIVSLINSCQMRDSSGRTGSATGTDGKAGQDGSDGVDGGDGGDGLDGINSELSDLEYMSCMLYSEQKKQDEWFESNSLYNSCGLVQSAVEGETVYETVEECTSAYTTTSGAASTCANYGDTTSAEYKEIDISIKFKLVHRAMIIIQNGVISIQPWYDWYAILNDGTSDAIGAIIGAFSFLGGLGFSPVGASLSSLYSALSERHFVGALPGEGIDCDSEDAGSLQQQQAIVTVDGNAYNWYWTGFSPFKILEFQNQYTFSTDCAIRNQKTDDDKNTYVDVKASTFNNFTYPMHFIQVENKEAETRYNKGCREVTVNFTLGYWKTLSSEYESYEYDYSALSEMCKDVVATE